MQGLALLIRMLLALQRLVSSQESTRHVSIDLVQLPGIILSPVEQSVLTVLKVVQSHGIAYRYTHVHFYAY